MAKLWDEKGESRKACSSAVPCFHSAENTGKAALILLVSSCAPGHSAGSRKPQSVTRNRLCEVTQQEPLKVTFALLGIICPKLLFVCLLACIGNKNIKAPK